MKKRVEIDFNYSNEMFELKVYKDFYLFKIKIETIYFENIADALDYLRKI